MAQKKEVNVTTTIKKAVESEKVIIGLKETLEAVRAKQTKEVYVASNCPSKVLEELSTLCELQKIPLTTLSIPNDELGVVCKKPYAILVLAIKNE